MSKVIYNYRVQGKLVVQSSVPCKISCHDKCIQPVCECCTLLHVLISCLARAYWFVASFLCSLIKWIVSICLCHVNVNPPSTLPIADGTIHSSSTHSPELFSSASSTHSPELFSSSSSASRRKLFRTMSSVPKSDLQTMSSVPESDLLPNSSSLEETVDLTGGLASSMMYLCRQTLIRFWAQYMWASLYLPTLWSHIKCVVPSCWLPWVLPLTSCGLSPTQNNTIDLVLVVSFTYPIIILGIDISSMVNKVPYVIIP